MIFGLWTQGFSSLCLRRDRDANAPLSPAHAAGRGLTAQPFNARLTISHAADTRMHHMLTCTLTVCKHIEWKLSFKSLTISITQAFSDPRGSNERVSPTMTFVGRPTGKGTQTRIHTNTFTQRFSLLICSCSCQTNSRL